MNFLQFFIWGSWLCTLGLYMTTPVEDGGLAFDGALVGSVFALSGIASALGRSYFSFLCGVRYRL